MKRTLVLFAGFLAAVVFACAETGVVTADRVNLRAQAKANAEVITQLAKGDRLTILDKKNVPYGSRTMTWLKVALPEKATVWIKGEFVKEGVVTGEKVNLRAGAGVNFSILGQTHKGEKLQILRTAGEWHEIRPLPGTFGWISSDYVELTPDLQPPPPSEQVQPVIPPVGDAAPKPTTTNGVTVVESPVKAVEPAKPTEAPIISKDADGPPQPVTRQGILRTCSGYLLKRPGTHALWDESASRPQIIAYLNSAGISLDKFNGHKVQIVGMETRLINWQNPVIDVQELSPMW